MGRSRPIQAVLALALFAPLFPPSSSVAPTPCPRRSCNPQAVSRVNLGTPVSSTRNFSSEA